jgi:hypothetical protein
VLVTLGAAGTAVVLALVTLRPAVVTTEASPLAVVPAADTDVAAVQPGVDASPSAAAPAGAAGSAGAAQAAAAVVVPGVVREDALVVGLAALASAGQDIKHMMDGAKPSAAAKKPGAAGAPRRSVGGIRAAWHSGASGDAAANGSFASWRGSSVQIVGTWADTSAADQTDASALDTYRNWNGDVDIAVGGLTDGETWAQAAAGAYMGRWAESIRNIKAKRAGRSGTTYIRFAHEMTGDWYAWRVTSANVGDFKKAWRMYHDLLAREFPQAKLVFSPNDGNASGVPLSTIWPGDSYVDVVGPDSYDGYPNKTSQDLWDEAFSSTSDGPEGLGSWLAFARAHGKPLALPEWGLRSADNPFYIQKMHQFLAGCAARPGETNLAGKCIYDIYFNIAESGNAHFMIYGGANPEAGQAYRALTWGTH